eukprot:gene24708-biopygen4435
MRLFAEKWWGCWENWCPGPLGSQDSGAGVARAWRGRGAGHRHFFGLGGAGVARAWRGRGAGMSCDPWHKKPAF